MLGLSPRANIPTVAFPVAEPLFELFAEEVAELTLSFEYVYLLRAVVAPKEQFIPRANIPTVLVPAAAPRAEQAEAEPPALTTQPEYVYLLRVVDGLLGVCPSANIANVSVSDGVTLLLNALIGDGP